MGNVTVDMVGRIPMSPSLAATLGRAHQHAGSHADAEVTLEHLLLALVDDPEAGGVLTLSGVDIAMLKSDIAAHLARGEDRRPPAPPGGARLSSDVQRILEAASAAAKGRRSEIDGAIVVAAIVGDGNSTAAHMLRARGLTFEEAIKALQRFASRASEPAPASRPTPPAATTPPPQPSRAGGSADDILASARQRVATRTGQAPQEPQSEPPTAPPATVPPSESPQQQQAKRPESSTRPPPLVAEPVAREADGAAGELASEWTPAAVPAPPLPERIAVPGARPPPLRRAEPSPREEPPPVPSPAAPGAAAPRPPAYPPQEGWAPGGDRAPGPPPTPSRVPPPMPPEQAVRPPPSARASGPYRPPDLLDPASARPLGGRTPRNLAAPPAPPPPTAAPAAAPPPAARADAETQRPPQRARAASDKSRAGTTLERGQMAENIPRSMQVGVPKTAEVRIAKADVKALAEGLQGGGTVWQHDVMISKAMSVRLRAPEGGFFIETASPETQWIENHLGGPFADDTASWRWTITPKVRGTRRLLLVVSVRTVGTDGLAAETALPDQVFEVRVRTNYGLAAQKWAGWTVAAVAGGLLARFGDGLLDAVVTGIKVLIK